MVYVKIIFATFVGALQDQDVMGFWPLTRDFNTEDISMHANNAIFHDIDFLQDTLHLPGEPWSYIEIQNLIPYPLSQFTWSVYFKPDSDIAGTLFYFDTSALIPQSAIDIRYDGTLSVTFGHSTYTTDSAMLSIQEWNLLAVSCDFMSLMLSMRVNDTVVTVEMDQPMIMEMFWKMYAGGKPVTVVNSGNSESLVGGMACLRLWSSFKNLTETDFSHDLCPSMTGKTSILSFIENSILKM